MWGSNGEQNRKNVVLRTRTAQRAATPATPNTRLPPGGREMRLQAAWDRAEGRGQCAIHGYGSPNAPAPAHSAERRSRALKPGRRVDPDELRGGGRSTSGPKLLGRHRRRCGTVIVRRAGAAAAFDGGSGSSLGHDDRRRRPRRLRRVQRERSAPSDRPPRWLTNGTRRRRVRFCRRFHGDVLVDNGGR